MKITVKQRLKQFKRMQLISFLFFVTSLTILLMLALFDIITTLTQVILTTFLLILFLSIKKVIRGKAQLLILHTKNKLINEYVEKINGEKEYAKTEQTKNTKRVG
jgi:hypothetical protein